MKKKYETLKNKYISLENKLKFKKLQLQMKNKMLTRRIKTIMNKEEKEKKISTCTDEESLLYDDLYEELYTYNSTIAVQPERTSSGQEATPSSQTDNTEIREETVHQRQDLLLDEFLKKEFKIYPESETESE